MVPTLTTFPTLTFSYLDNFSESDNRCQGRKWTSDSEKIKLSQKVTNSVKTKKIEFSRLKFYFLIIHLAFSHFSVGLLVRENKNEKTDSARDKEVTKLGLRLSIVRFDLLKNAKTLARFY